MTPAVSALQSRGIRHRLLTYDYGHDGDGGIGATAARKLGLAPEEVYKTLIARLPDGELVVAVIPVADHLNLKLLARAVGVKSAELAEPAAAERASGYLIGGISPIAQKRALRTFIDAAARALPEVYVCAGRRGLELALSPSDLIAVTDARVVELT